MSSSYHPHTDGQSEVINRRFEQYILYLAHQRPNKWYSFQPWAEYQYNTTYHSSIGMTPFQALYGRLPPTIPHYVEGTTAVNEVDQQLTAQDELLTKLKANLHAAQNYMKQSADNRHRHVEFQVGDWVFCAFNLTVNRPCSRELSKNWLTVSLVHFRLKLESVQQHTPSSYHHPRSFTRYSMSPFSRNKSKTKLSPPKTCQQQPKKEPSSCNPKQFWITTGSKRASKQWKKVQSNGSTFPSRMPLGKTLPNDKTISSTSTLRTRFIFRRGVMINPQLQAEDLAGFP